MDTAQITDAQLEQVAFIGNALAPFFLEDPIGGNAGASLAAMAALDPVQAAQEWPFVEAADVEEPLSLMARGAGEEPAALAREYRRLFVGPAHKATPPWGSVYTDRECVVFGASTLELRRWMHERRLTAPGGTHVPEDHIGLLLALMAQLALTMPDELDDFLSHHLLTWCGHFFKLVADEADLPFYRGLALVADASLTGIAHARNLHVVEPRFYR